MEQTQDNDIVSSARDLLASTFHGVLATQSTAHPGYPFGSLLPYSIGHDGWPLLLISHLAQHTKNLLQNRHCNLTIVESGDGDVQTRTRLSCLADAIELDDPDEATCNRHFRYFPESSAYFHELNFRFFRLQPVRFHCVAGFGAARWIGTDRMTLNNPFATEQEAQLLEQINREFTAELPLPGESPLRETQPTAVGLDGAGLDLRFQDRLYRLRFEIQTTNTEALLGQLKAQLTGGRQLP